MVLSIGVKRAEKVTNPENVLADQKNGAMNTFVPMNV